MVLAAVLVALVVLALIAWLLLRRLRGNLIARAFGRRLTRLSFRQKLRLAWALVRDPRIPCAVRAIPVLLVLYLAMPLDLVPDFLPVIGQLDDLLILAIGAGLMVRFVPRAVLEEHIDRIEAADTYIRNP
jgi:uncharacterized membrane protein YkvA (DUF1232 family)